MLLLLLLILNIILSSACSSLPPFRKSGSEERPKIFNLKAFLGCVTLVFSYAWLICGASLAVLIVLVSIVLLLAPRGK